MEWFGGARSAAGTTVSETSVMGLVAVQRAVQLIAWSISMLPLRAIHEHGGITEPLPSWLDNPWGSLTRGELVRLILSHLLLHGNCYLIHVYGGAGQLLGVTPIHPNAVCIDVDEKTSRKTYRVSLIDGTQQVFDDYTLTHIRGHCFDGIHGLSPLQVASNAFGTALAADAGAAKFHGEGPTISAIVQFEESTAPEDAKSLRDDLEKRLTGQANSSRIAYLNRNVTITPFTISHADSQWLESREYQAHDIATLFGIPSHLIGLEQKNSSFGTGIAEMSRGFALWTLMGWSTIVEERLSLLLPEGQTAEFNYAKLVQPDFAKQVELCVQQAGGPYSTINEVRKVQNLPPIDGGDVLRTSAAPSAPTDPETAA
jgi:HK97 family phage portal protein